MSPRQFLYENENARLLAEKVINKYPNLSTHEISEDVAMSMYLLATDGTYYTNRSNKTYIPVLSLKVI